MWRSLSVTYLKSTVHVQIGTQDANNISFSMLFPRPPQASVGKSDGILTWTPLDIQLVYLAIRVNDQLFSSQFTLILQVCNCLNGGTCQYDSIADNHLQGRFQVVGCLWPNSVGIPPKRVKGSLTSQECSASPSLNPRERQTSSPVDSAPPPTVYEDRQGYKCFEDDFYLPPFLFRRHKMADSISSGYNYTCRCKPGFTGDGCHCTDIDECLDHSACPKATF
ncbi:mucin-like protein [Oncorhynchus nerka]|uniref:mucin-like protein n=1 Tax=Oncorhynchus nerka TaxID=8023 RepID=UPI00113218E4|nr:mucin-like protein [Oncorhynchus nerka]